MRTLCLLLILANALFFIWSQLIDAQVNALDRISPPSAAPPARIVLAREVVRENVEEDAPAQVSEVMPPTVEPLEQPPQTENAPVASCTSIGPFPDLPQAAEVQSTLRAKGHESRQRVEQGEWWVGYWVSVPNLDTRAAAQAAIEKLRNNGVTDVYLMPESDLGNVVSLGVFSDYQRAQRRTDQVRALGFEPRISDRRRAGSVYWLDVDLREPGETLDASVFQTGEARIMRLEMRACPSRAGDGG